MKRVIDINESTYERLIESRGMSVGAFVGFAEALKKSEPLNEVLDKMSGEVQRIRAPRCTYAGNDYFRGREDTVNRVLDIINKYKGSEEV